MNKKLIIVFAVFAVIGVGIFYFLTAGNVGTEYNTVEVIKGEQGSFIEDVGTISSKNIRRYYGNGVSKIDEMTLSVGDYINKGDLIIKYEDNLDLEIKSVEKQIKALEASYNEALSGMDMESVSSARIEVSRIRNQIEQAQMDIDRKEALYNNGAISLNELELAINYIDELKSSLGIAQNSYSQVKKGLSTNLVDKFEAEIDVLLLTLEKLENTRKDYAIHSDIEGIVTEINTFEGDIPSPAIMMIEIQDPTEKVILVDFMVEDAMKVTAGMTAEISDVTLDVHIDGLEVERINPKAFITLSELSVEENRQRVEIGLSDEGKALVYGLEVNTRVMVDAPREILLIPEGAVIREGDMQYVKVLFKGNLVEKEITTGFKVDGKVEVKSGLEAGELVILNYQED